VKDDQKGKKGGRLLGDGLPHLLMDDEFYKKIKAHWEAVKAAEQAQVDKRWQKQDFATEMENLQKEDAERRRQNKELDALWKDAKNEWNSRKAKVKAAGGKIKDWMQENLKPKKSDPEFKPEKAIPRPKLHGRVAVGAGELDGEAFDFGNSSDNGE